MGSGYVDPDVASFIRATLTAQAAAPSSGPPTVESARQAVSERTRRLTSPSVSMRRSFELFAGGPNGDIGLNIHQPASDRAPLPVVIYYHGGGCVLMSPEEYRGVTTRLAAAAECIVVVPDFRLAPENPFPAPLDDAYAVLLWVQQNALSFGGDPVRVVVAGDSGGGYLAAAVTLEAKSRGTAMPAHQVLVYPQVDMAATHRAAQVDCSADPALAEWMRGFELLLAWTIALHVPENKLDPRASPLRAGDLSGLPSAFVLTAEYDLLAEEARAYVRQLRDAGVRVSHLEYSGVHHGFLQYGAAIRVADEAIEHLAAVIRSAVGPRSVPLPGQDTERTREASL